MVGSSVIAAWSDISSTLNKLSAGVALVDPTSGADIPIPTSVIGQLNIGYVWMFTNCIASAAYVSRVVTISGRGECAESRNRFCVCGNE